MTLLKSLDRHHLARDSTTQLSPMPKVTDKNLITYLAKLVKLVGMQLNTIVEARPTKIVSGLEPNNTNRLLQLFAAAASFAPNSITCAGCTCIGGVSELQACRAFKRGDKV